MAVCEGRRRVVSQGNITTIYGSMEMASPLSGWLAQPALFLKGTH